MQDLRLNFLDKMLMLVKRIVLVAAGCVSFIVGSAQVELNKPDHDEWPYYFGMSISYINSGFHSTKHETFITSDSIMSVDAKSSGGIGLGLLATAKINRRFEARFNPTLIIGGSRKFVYANRYPAFGEQSREEKKLPSTVVSLPLQIKFNSDRINNFRVYLLGGIKYDIDLASNAASRNADNLVKLKSADFGVEVGIGFNFYLQFVTISPELKFGSGLTNVHARDPNLKFSNILDKLQSRMISFTLILED